MREFNAIRCAIKEKHTSHLELKGVYHKGGCKIATDSHILVAIKSEYPAELEGKIVAKDASIIDARFPNYNRVISSIKRCKNRDIDAVKLKEAIEKCKKAINDTIVLHFIRIADDLVIPVEKAELVLSFIKTYKITKVDLHLSKAPKCMRLTSNDNMMLCMGIDGKMKKKYIIDEEITKKI